MNEQDIDRLIARARAIADNFDLIGNRQDAEVIRRLCRSREQSRETNKRFYRDNLALRRGEV